jgi:tripeptide aminopeptidase
VRIPGTIDSDPLLFSAHMDTVEPGKNIKAVVTDDDFIRSKGDTILGSDDKAAIAAILEAYDIIRENELLHPPLEFLFTISEEQGLQGAKVFDFKKLRSKIGYTLDAGGNPGTIIVQSPCQNEIEYIAYGKAAHAGMNPEDGVNAIKLAAHAMSIMPCGRIDNDTTCNFGIIKGGKARNIVADICKIKGEVRSLKQRKLDELTDKLVFMFKNKVAQQGGRGEVITQFLYPAIKLDPDEEVIRLAVKAAEEIGITPNLVSTGGGSDASIINGNGIRCANLGIGMRDVHTTNEHISIADLVNDVRLVLAIIKKACNE